MRSSVPDGDLARIIDIAITEKLERLEAKRFGKTRAPRKDVSQTDTTPKSRKVPAAIRRAVHERDEGRCTYGDARGPAGERTDFELVAGSGTARTFVCERRTASSRRQGFQGAMAFVKKGRSG